MKMKIGDQILTRVEGHGSLEFVLEGDAIVDAHFHLNESPRLFEKLLIGRAYDEIADIACRICSICSTVHKVASLQTIESAFGMVVSELTTSMRRLAMLGGIIESHALHLICLALPDYEGAGSFAGLAAAAPKELAAGLKIKQFGNLLQETIGGRAIHPFNLRLGGMGALPSNNQLLLLEKELWNLSEHRCLVEQLCKSLSPLIPLLPTLECAAVDSSQQHLITSSGESITKNLVIDWLHQESITGSNAPISRFCGNTPHIFGPLARQKLAGNMDADTQLSASPQARWLELQQALDEAGRILEKFMSRRIIGEEPIAPEPKAAEAVVITEAPRGTLIHGYCFDDNGICTAATVITPTAMNQAAMQQSLTDLIFAMNGAPEAHVRFAAEHLIRLFDPCISCAVH